MHRKLCHTMLYSFGDIVHVSYSLVDVVRFTTFDYMSRDANAMLEFKRAVGDRFCGSKAYYGKCESLVAVKYDGTLCCFHVDSSDVHKWLGGLLPHENGYYVWTTFPSKREAIDYEEKLKTIDYMKFVPVDPSVKKEARYVSCSMIFIG